MKKTYISPAMKTAEMEMESLICQSIQMKSTGFSLDNENDATLGSGLVKRQNSDITSSNAWDEDEDW